MTAKRLPRSVPRDVDQALPVCYGIQVKLLRLKRRRDSRIQADFGDMQIPSDRIAAFRLGTCPKLERPERVIFEAKMHRRTVPANQGAARRRFNPTLA